MAKIIKKGYQLEKKYLDIRRRGEGHQKEKRKNIMIALLICSAIYAAVICFDAFYIGGKLLIPASLVFALIVMCTFTYYICIPDLHANDHKDMQILRSGISGEWVTAEELSLLPDDYTIFQDIEVEYDGKISEIDNIVVGKSGVFIVESKNHGGVIAGDYEDTYWTQDKISRGGRLYSKEIYSPVKQVSTHIYRLANLLRDNGVFTYVRGIVYFTNENTSVRISGNENDIPVFSYYDAGMMRRAILNGGARLTVAEADHIVGIIDAL